jgi:hypothetical protein
MALLDATTRKSTALSVMPWVHATLLIHKHFDL